MLYQQEIVLVSLYQVFAARFAERAYFWNDLAEEEIRHAEPIKEKSAVAHTLDLEKSLVENNVFSRFEAREPRMKAALRRLENETREHAAKARSLMEKI